MRKLTGVNYCDLCGSHEFTPELQVGTWRLMRCGDYGLVSTSPRYTEGTIAQLYSAEYYQNTPAYYLLQMSPPSTDDLNLARSAAESLRRKGRSLVGPRVRNRPTGQGVPAGGLSSLGYAPMQKGSLHQRPHHKAQRPGLLGIHGLDCESIG